MENSYNNADTQLIPFLRELANSIEANQLSPNKLKHIGEFYMNYTMQEELSEEKNDENFDDMDIIRFLTLGWWIYTHILKNNNEEEDNNKTSKIDPSTLD